MRKILLALAILLFPVAALAQSSPGLVNGQVPTAAQWNSYFAAKQDVLGYRPVNVNGDIMLGRFVTFASTVTAAGFNIPPGVAPTVPINGDVWTTSAGMFVRIAGTTVGPLSGTGSSGTNIWLGDQYFASGRPWVDIRGFGALGNQTGDDGPAIQRALNFLTTNFGGGMVYSPNGNYCIKTPVVSTTARVRFVGESTGVLWQTCGADITPFTLNGFGDTIEDMSIAGPSIVTTTHDGLHVGSNCVECRIYNSHFQEGRYAVFNEAPDVTYLDDRLDVAYGGAMFYTTQGVYMLRVKLDQNMVAGTPTFGTYTPTAWSASHTYAANAIVSDAGFYLQTIAGGTSGASLPTVLPYAQNITDGSVTWQLLAPVSYYALQIDTGANSLSNYFGDFSGPFTAAVGITNTLSGAAPSGIVIDNGDFGQNFVAGVWAQAGNNLVISNSQSANCFNVSCSGILFDTGFLGDATVSNTVIFQNAIGINILGGTNYATLGSKVYASSTSGINVAAGISGFKIIGNDAGVSPVWGANLVGVTVQAGSSDNYTITGNNFNGVTTAVIDGGTGSNKCVQSGQGAIICGGTITSQRFVAAGVGGQGYFQAVTQSAAPVAPASGYRLYANSTGHFSWINQSDGFTRSFNDVLTANRVWTLPDASMTLAGINLAQTFSAVQTFGAAPVFSTITGSTQCLQANSAGSVSGAGAACLLGNQTITLSGDVTGSGATAISTTLATVNSNVGTFGSATQAAQVTVNAKGLTTAASNVTITPAVGSITGLGTGVGTFLATPTSANFFGAITDETGTGVVVANTSPVFVTGLTVPAVFGGSAAGSALNLQSTSSGAPSGDKVSVTTGGLARATWLSNGNLGLGTEINPQGAMVLSSNTSTGIAVANATGITVAGADGANANLTMQTYTNGGATNSSTIQFVVGRGTAAAPTALLSGDLEGIFGFRPYIGAATLPSGNTGRIAAVATENQSATNEGNKLNVDLTRNTTTSRATVTSIDGWAHMGFFTPTGQSAPAATGCGSGATTATGSTDMAGSVTEGTTATGCTITFANPFAVANFCNVDISPLPLAFSKSVSLSAITVTNTSATGDIITWTCHGS